jgi:PAS domain S-box-containing protein
MNSLFLIYSLAFGLATVACGLGIVRARRIEDEAVRNGLVGLLAGSGAWAASHAILFLLRPSTLARVVYIVGLIFGFSTVWAWLYFCSAYTGRVYHRSTLLRRLGLGTYLAVVAVKLTNPFHGLYFRAEVAQEPFPHLAIQQGLFHWTVTGLSYALATVGLFVLFESFVRSDYDTRPLGVLASLTAVPVVLDIVAFATPELVDVIYAPLGVGAFAVGVLYVYEGRFFAVGLGGNREAPTLVLDGGSLVRDYNDAAQSTFSDVASATGDPLQSVVPDPDIEPEDEGGQIVPVETETDTEYYVESRETISLGDDEFGEVVTYADVSRAERRRRELERTYDRLERERDRFAKLFENLPDPVNEVEFVDGQPVIRAVNPAFEETFGYERGSVVDEPAAGVVLPPEPDGTAECLDERARDGAVVVEEVKRQTADGVRDFLFRGIPYGPDGERALGVYTDITDQKQRERRLQVLNRVLRHNVRNEMTVVTGYAELLDEELDDDRLGDAAAELLASAREVSAISEQARAVEKAVRRETEEPTDLPAVVETAVEEVRSRYPAATVETESPEHLRTVPAAGLDVAVANLVENGIEHNDGEPTVRVVVERDAEGWGVVRVTDDGPGIPDHERAVVAGDREVSQLEHGSGLGLWVVRWLTEAAGGEVNFEERETAGTVVELRLPTPESD